MSGICQKEEEEVEEKREERTEEEGENCRVIKGKIMIILYLTSSVSHVLKMSISKKYAANLVSLEGRRKRACLVSARAIGGDFDSRPERTLH